MNWMSLNIGLALPEITLLVGVSLLLLIDLFLKDDQRGMTFNLALFVLAIVAGVTYTGFVTEPTLAFNTMYVADPISSLSKLVLTGMVMLVLLYSRTYLEEKGLLKGEFFTLILFSLLGMQVMVSANHFLTLYMGLELLSLSMYALIALNRDNTASTEAAMKYFVLGALASGLLLYGISMVYGATGSLSIATVANQIALGHSNPLLVAFGLVFIVAGLAFKLGAVPFHMWVPDVYQGSPTPMTQFISSAPKLAAFVFVFRILGQALPSQLEQWQGMLIVVAILSMGLGNITAIAQTNIKRMLAYSTISHMGFLLLGMLTGSETGYAASFFYAVIYGFMSLAGFGLLIMLSRNGVEFENLDQLKGLNRRQPWFAFLMLLVMFSMAGIPPLVGFFAKLSVLNALLEANLAWVAVVAVIFSLIGAFYYLRVVKVMYFDEPSETALEMPTAGVGLLFGLNAIALLVLGVIPQSLINGVARAVQLSLLH